MIILSRYAFSNDTEAKQRLEARTVDLAVPKFWGGYFAVIKDKIYKVCWFASNKGKTIQSAIAVIENK